jgi:hypothetical protein
MFISSFFSWWYLTGWKQVISSLERRLKIVAELFSVKQLLQTLLSPWRKIISYPGGSFNDKLRAIGDNMVSRVIGFIVRLLVLVLALGTTIVVLLVSLIELIAWPILPPAVIVLLILGIIK